jgi:hypothetical protein
LISHRSIVGLGFKLASVVVGVPAAAGSLFCVVAAFQLHDAAVQAHSTHPISVQKYGIVGLVTDAAVGVDRVFGFFAELGVWVMGALAVGALIFALCAALLYPVGRGVARQAPWARVVGVGLALMMALSSLLAFTSLPLRLAAAPLPAMALAIYTIWVLIWRFYGPGATPAPTGESSSDDEA